MCHAISKGPFDLIRDELLGFDYWHKHGDKPLLPGNHRGRRVLLTVHDFYFAMDEEGDWFGPFQLRDQAVNFQRIMHTLPRAPKQVRSARQQGGSLRA